MKTATRSLIQCDGTYERQSDAIDLLMSLHWSSVKPKNRNELPPDSGSLRQTVKNYIIILFSFTFRYHTQGIYHIGFHVREGIEI
jgi:hypothetical protein